jgi:hypothetical protein
MAGYTMMSDEELGMNTYIKEDGIGKYIMFKGEDKAKEEKLYLEGRPICFSTSNCMQGNDLLSSEETGFEALGIRGQVLMAVG